MLVDWLTLGLLARSWESRRFGPFGAVLGYFDVEHFVPERWTPGYDPAMVRRTERDAATSLCAPELDDAPRDGDAGASLVSPEHERLRLGIARRALQERPHLCVDLDPVIGGRAARAIVLIARGGSSEGALRVHLATTPGVPARVVGVERLRELHAH